MKHEMVDARKRKAVNVSIDPDVVAEAREAGVNFSRVTEEALRVAVRAEHERRWLEENRTAIAAFGDWYARDGDPLAGLRVR